MHKLLDLADVLRSSGAFPVVEYQGWQTRGRSRDSGNYKDAYPDHVMEHHTASNTSAANDINYICHGSSDAPLSNLYLGRDGTMHVLAAGATNTNGKGHDYWGGGVANDDMNAHAIGIEIACNGTGERYTDAQQVTIVAATAALCRGYNIPIGNIRAHFEWAPDRKIDPSGPSKWSPSGGKWNMDAFRGDVLLHNAPSEPPPIVGEEESMIIINLNPGTPQWVAMQLSGTSVMHIVNGHHVNVLRRGGAPEVTIDETEMEGILRSVKAFNESPFKPGMPSFNENLNNLWNAAR